MFRVYVDTTTQIALGDPTKPLSSRGLHDATTGLPVNDAVVQLLSVTDRITGIAVSGISVPMALAYQNGSNGVYSATIPATAIFVAGLFYDFKVRITALSGTVLILSAYAPALMRI